MIKLGWDNRTGAGRLQVDPETGALATDRGLVSVVALCLFTNAEATAKEIETAGLDAQEGWWAEADGVRDPSRPRMGSKLWLLKREKTIAATLRRGEDYARNALRWLVDVKIAAEITVRMTVLRPGGFVGLEVTIVRPEKALPPFKHLWEFQTDAVL
ncbi:MAG: phage GP46 family protein [Myxococcales bacterium]|nr:phage GP46 family protein [Myxococcales bacterium]